MSGPSQADRRYWRVASTECRAAHAPSPIRQLQGKKTTRNTLCLWFGSRVHDVACLFLFQVNQELEIPPTRVLQLELNPQQWLVVFFYPNDSQLIQIISKPSHLPNNYTLPSFHSCCNDDVIVLFLKLLFVSFYPVIQRSALFLAKAVFTWIVLQILESSSSTVLNKNLKHAWMEFSTNRSNKNRFLLKH